MVWRRGPTGVRERGTHARGLPRNLGDLVDSVKESRWGPENQTPGPKGAAPVSEGANKERSTVPPNEGNEVRRDGQREVGSLHTTCEAGEPDPEGTPRRKGSDGNTELPGGTMTGTRSPTRISTRLRQVAELAQRDPEWILTTLAHHIDIEFLREAYRRTRKSGATGVDGQTAAEYAEHLEANLQSLLDRFKSGTYRAPPVRRVHIPKGDGKKTRPIGVPTFEDKLLQRAVAMLLEAVYEQDFYDCSYGFRPRRSAHQALDALWKTLMKMRGGWVLEVDIQSFFDVLSHSHLRAFLDQRVRDGVLRRAINKWLKAGVMEEGQLTRPKTGSPQGGVISPVLANIYLHVVLDTWFHEMVLPCMRGRAVLVRYADDAVMVFEREADAHRVMEALPKRLGKYDLTAHPEKTRLVPFCRPTQGAKKGSAGTFDLLGFTHFWGRSRKGSWVVKRRTAKSRFTRALHQVSAWCRANRHQPVAEQHRQLVAKLRGHCAYYGITGNADALSRFAYGIVCAWQKWLNRRSQRARMGWDRFTRLLQRYPLRAIAVHSVLRQGARP